MWHIRRNRPNHQTLILTFKNKFFIIALENHISNGGFALNYFKQIYLTKPQNFSKSRWLEWGSWRGKPIEGTQPTTHGGGPATFPAPWWRTKIQIDGTDRWQINTSTLSEFKNIYNRNITKIGADIDDTDPLYPNVIFSFPNLCYFDPDGCQGRTKYATYTLVFKGTAVKDEKEEEITKQGFSSTTIVNVPLKYLPPPPKINLSINSEYNTATITREINSDNYYIFAVTTTEEFKPFSDFLKNSNGKLTYNPFYGLNDDDVCSVAFAVTTTSATAGGATLSGEKTGITTGGWIDITKEIVDKAKQINDEYIDALKLGNNKNSLILESDKKIKVRLLKFLTMPQNPKSFESEVNIEEGIKSIQNLFGSSTYIGGGKYLTKNLFKDIIKSVDNNAFDGEKLQIRFTCHQDWDRDGYQDNNSTSTDMIEETLTFNLTPRSAVLIPTERSEYTGKGTPKTATFNAKIHIVDASPTSDVSLVINEIEGNITNAKISYEGFSTSTTINQGQNIIKIGNASNGKFLKKMNIELQYTTTTRIEIWGKYTIKKDEERNTNSVEIQVNY
jgi:hypothetical protein